MGSRLEELTPGASVDGLVAGETVTVVAVEWHGSTCVTLTYRNAAGRSDHQLVYRADEERLNLAGRGRAWAFDADGEVFRLVAEARRIRLAYLFDPRLAVHLSLLEPLPHQIQAVYGELLPRQPLRFALCDDPGAGKTIMAGLYIKELLLRGDLRRCLVVAPGGLVGQWQDELADRFGLSFSILTREMIEATKTGDALAENDLLIARLDHLSRNDDLVERLRHTEWDLVVVDEAHRMSAHFFGNELKETKRYKLGKVLGEVARNFLLMTATPHAGKEEDFQLFMALLDSDRFAGKSRDGVRAADTSDLMRRMIKEKLLRFDGRPLFPERRATTVNYPLSDDEAVLYAQVTEYVTEEMNRADRITAEGDGRRGNRVGFAVTVLQRRLASSPEAIYQSLRRRRLRLEERLAEERAVARGAAIRKDRETHAATLRAELAAIADDADPDDIEDLEETEVEEVTEVLVDSATAARTVVELEAEIATLTRLEARAGQIRRSGEDRKWLELAGLLEKAAELRDPAGERRKLIVFTEHRDTLTYLVERLRRFLGRPEAVVAIHGGVHRDERRRIQEVFSQDRDCLVLVATDAAGEGVNLQQAHLLVNYDLPWNPNRIEQRFGRVHRIGQHEVCHMWNLVAADTREGLVYGRLLLKLEEQRKALGGQVFDVLGSALPGRALRDLLMEAIRYGDRPEVRARLSEVVDASVGDGLSDLVAEHALASDVLGAAEVERIARDLAEAEAKRLQPHYVRAWFTDAFARLGGRLAERETGRFEITKVPTAVRQRDRATGAGAPVLAAYQRVTFDKHLMRQLGHPTAELVAPGHPLLEAVLDLTRERDGDALRRGTVLIDDTDPGDQASLLVLLEHSITDGRSTGANPTGGASAGSGAGRADGGHRVVSRRFEFVRLRPDGTAAEAGYAPYLDLRPPTDEEADALAPLRDEPWLATDLDKVALDHAISVSVPAHLAQVRLATDARVAKVRAAVRDRLTKEIAHWELRAADLREQAARGRQPRMNPNRAQSRADEMADRMGARLAELEREQQIAAQPPVIVGGALVVPAGLPALARLRSDGEGAAEAPVPSAFAVDTKVVERRAVDKVMDAEGDLGFAPVEQAHNNPGFDIRSDAPDGVVRFLEVKGRIAGSEVFMITRNELLHALNVPDAWILALVEVSPDGAAHDRVRYLRRPFGDTLHLPFATTAAALDWRDYWNRGEAPS